MANTGKPIQVLFGTIVFGAAASTTEIGSLPPNAVLSDIIVDVQTAFDSGTSDTLEVGHGAFGSTSADPNYYETAVDVKTAAGRIATTVLNGGAVVSASDSVPITVTYTPVGTAATAGSCTVAVEYIQQ